MVRVINHRTNDQREVMLSLPLQVFRLRQNVFSEKKLYWSTTGWVPSSSIWRNLIAGAGRAVRTLQNPPGLKRSTTMFG